MFTSPFCLRYTSKFFVNTYLNPAFTISVTSVLCDNSNLLRFFPKRLHSSKTVGNIIVSKNEVQEYFESLSTEEKKSFIADFQKLYAVEVKSSYERQLANMRWRSKLGRQASSTDVTGTYCEVPTQWVKKKIAEGLPPPTLGELFKLARFHAMPFIGFGFLDNLVMILAGDYIDLTIGATLGISTMAAAALGNAVSDVAGIGSAWYVESLAEKIGVTPPNLHPSQLESSNARWFSNMGRAFGVLLGCIIGMFPLLFLPTHPKSESNPDESP